MSTPRVTVYLDEDVAVVVAPMLAAGGFAAVTTRDAGLIGASDRAQLDHATENGWLLVTHNRADFVRLAREYVETGREHAGMLLCTRRPPRALADRISAVLHGLDAISIPGVVLHA